MFFNLMVDVFVLLLVKYLGATNEEILGTAIVCLGMTVVMELVRRTKN